LDPRELRLLSENLRVVDLVGIRGVRLGSALRDHVLRRRR